MIVFNVGSLRPWALLSLCIFFTACTPPNSDELLTKAQDYLAADESHSAVIELKNALQLDPHNAEAQFLLGEIYISKGDLSLALRELEGAFDSGMAKERVQKPLLKTKTLQGRYREVIGELEGEIGLDAELETILGEAYLVGKNYDKARSHFNKALNLQPKNGGAALGLARTAFVSGDLFAAAGHYSDAVLWAPQSQEAWIHKGNYELASQKSGLALESFEQALKLDGPTYLANLGIARSYITLDRMDDAEVAINSVLSETGKIPVAYYIKAQILFQKAEFSRADKVLKRALNIAPNYSAALYLKAAIYYQEKKFNLAADLLRNLLKVHPDNMQVRLLLATSQFRTGDSKAALAILEPHIEKIETSNGLALLGSLYLQNNNQKDGIKSLQAALNLDPGNNKLRTQLALGYLAGGDAVNAVKELERAVAGGGELVQADALLVLVKLRDGDFNAALAEAQKFQKRHPESVIAHNLLGSVHLALLNTDEAKSAFERAKNLDTSYSPAVLNLAKMATSTGDFEGARTLYSNFLSSNPQSIEAYIALGQLELEVGNVGAATNSFTKAEKLDISVNGEPKIANIPFELGRVELKKKNVELARNYFNQAIDISSGKHKQALLGLIQIERSEGNRELVKILLSRLEKIMPGTVIYYMLLAEFQLEDSQVASARANFGLAADLNHRGATLRYAGFLEAHNEIELAISVLEDWLEANSRDLSALAMLGGYYLKQETPDKAIRVYESLDGYAPNNAAVLNNLAWAYYLKKDERAEAVARTAYELSPDNAHMADTLGWILVQNGNFSDALIIFDKALRLDPDNASIYYHAAVAYSRSSRVQDARTSLEKALALGEFPERSEAENLVNRLKI